MLKVLDLFSGIGGFSLGLESTGYFKTIAFCEKDKFCQKVLQKNFKDIPIEGEIRNVKGEKYKADVVTGGFPCQPFSVAGKRKGSDDDRYLWDETIRVVRECKPRWFIGENVEGLVNIQEGMVLRQVQTDLEKEGFEVQCLIIPASGIGAWHQRKRVWIIANSSTIRRSDTSANNTQNEQKEFSKKNVKFSIKSPLSSYVSNTNSRLSIRENQEIQTRGNTIDSIGKTNDQNVANTKCLGWYERIKESEKFERKKTSNKFNNCLKRQPIGKTYLSMDDVWHSKSSRHESSTYRQRERKLWGTDTSTVQRQRTWWEVESELCGIPYGLSSRLDKDRANRIKALGNSVVPQIIRELGLAIIDAERETY